MAKVTEVKRKICLIGDGGVGKTSLIRRFVFDQFDDKYLITFGTKVTKKSIELKKDKNEKINMNLLIWDVMGQEGFKKAQEYAYNGANGAFIVCDLTNYESLENMMGWHKDLLSIAKKIPVIILANKNDLHKKAEITSANLKDVAKQLKASYILTSARTGENVESAFMEISSKLI